MSDNSAVKFSRGRARDGQVKVRTVRDEVVTVHSPIYHLCVCVCVCVCVYTRVRRVTAVSGLGKTFSTIISITARYINHTQEPETPFILLVSSICGAGQILAQHHRIKFYSASSSVVH